MPKEQRLFLHVGPHKTGTSSFQRAVAERAEALHAAGLAVWRDSEGRSNAGALANLVTRPELQTAPRLRGRTGAVNDERRRRAARRVARWAANAPEDLLISSEAFSHLRSAQEADWLRAILPDGITRIVPILVRRPLADWRASRRAQLEKVGVVAALDALNDDALSCDGEWYYDWARLETFWATFGPPLVLDYATEVAAHGSILPALARAIEQPDSLTGLEATWLNERPR
jgi:hypothetical protein